MQFRQPEFEQQVLAALRRSGANPKNLKLELTESMLVDNIEEVIQKMTYLRSHEISFSLDDFGTGYSSLSYLKRLPLNQLKIDRSFVRDILTDASSGAIAQAIISLGRTMSLPVIAEGVETEEQRVYLARMGCHAFQGFLTSRPLPLVEFESLLDALRGSRSFAPNSRVRSQLLTISYQLSVLSYQLSTISSQLSVLNYQFSAISSQLSVLSN